MKLLLKWLLVFVLSRGNYELEVQGRELEEKQCSNENGVLDFIVLEGDENKVALEDDIKAQLEKIGFEVNTRILNKEEYNAAHSIGDYHISFYKSYGAPYDPQAYTSEWKDDQGGIYHALGGLEPPASREELFKMIDDVRGQEDPEKRSKQWEDIHNYYHKQAVFLGLWGRRVPTIMNRRLTGYVVGKQEFDYPVHRLSILSGSSTVNIAPAGQTGRFRSVGRLDPHTYRPNEFFANNWVYEGLVEYGQDGQILPSLATSWSYDDSTMEYTFQLRENVQFHDGQPWNCQAAKLNFDHVLAEPLRGPNWHGWYGVPEVIKEWRCGEGDYEFVVTLKDKYYPFLQELTYIRPLRMLSPAAFAKEGDPITANSCHAGWGNVTEDGKTISCAGITNISGTGPWVFLSRDTVQEEDGSEYDRDVLFVRNENHWGNVPGSIKTLRIAYYASNEQAKGALIDGSLDVLWGSGILLDKEIQEIQQREDQKLQVFHSDNIQNDLLILNSGKAPLDDINLRNAIMHAIDKEYLVKKELGPMQQVVDNVFPLEAPYCDVELTPSWQYDIEKAFELACHSSDSSSSSSSLAEDIKDPRPEEDMEDPVPVPETDEQEEEASTAEEEEEGGSGSPVIGLGFGLVSIMCLAVLGL